MDEEEQDRQTLIPHSDQTHLPKLPESPSIFQIDQRTPKPTFPKRYLLAIFLPLFILIVYLSTHFKTPFTNYGTALDTPFLHRLRESESKAIYLLKQQQLELFKLWNHTIYSDFEFNDTRLNLTRDFLKSSVLSQISVNKQIQQVILSGYGSDANSGFENNVTELNRCEKIDYKLSERKRVDWKPSKNKFLFAICVSGQMSNHLICLEKHMFFAALLGRTLVIPSSKVDYQFDHVLDIEHINKCLGDNVVVTFDQFAEAKKSNLRINKFICYFSSPTPCFLDDDHVKKLKSLGISMNGLDPAWDEDVRSPSKRTMGEIVLKFSLEDEVIAIGDMFFANVEHDMAMQPGGAIAHNCKTLIEPSKLIMITAQRFVQTFLGEKFIALHFRRHGFLKFCNAKQPSCFFPVPQAADCINRLVEKANTPVIYLSTDAAESETNLLQSLILLNGKIVPLVKRPARDSAEKWDALLYRKGIEGDPQVKAMLDKAICAMSTVFIGSSGSTFSEDIIRLRKDWGSASVCDEYLCQGETPNFIADNE